MDWAALAAVRASLLLHQVRFTIYSWNGRPEVNQKSTDSEQILFTQTPRDGRPSSFAQCPHPKGTVTEE